MSAGDILQVIGETNSEWLKVDKSGQIGFIPLSYASLLNKSAKALHDYTANTTGELSLKGTYYFLSFINL